MDICFQPRIVNLLSTKETQWCEIFYLAWNKLDLCAAAYKLISHVNASTASIAFSSCAGSGFFCSKHPNHTGHNFEEFPETLNSSPGLPPVLASNLNWNCQMWINIACSQHSQHFNHTGHKCEEFPGTLNSGPGLHLVSASKLNWNFQILINIERKIGCVLNILKTLITPVKVLRNSQEE